MVVSVCGHPQAHAVYVRLLQTLIDVSSPPPLDLAHSSSTHMNLTHMNNVRGVDVVDRVATFAGEVGEAARRQPEPASSALTNPANLHQRALRRRGLECASVNDCMAIEGVRIEEFMRSPPSWIPCDGVKMMDVQTDA